MATKQKKIKTKKILTENKKPLLLSLSVKDKVFLARHLSVMLKAGIPVHEGLESLAEQSENPSIKYILSIATKDISDGQVLAFSLKKFPKIFDDFFTNVIEVGESSGTLPESLAYLSTQLEKSMEIRAKVRSALIYPIIILFGSVGVGSYLAFFILPQLMPLFSSLGTKLPVTTRMLLWITNTLTTYWHFMAIGLVLFIIILAILWRIEKVKLKIHTIMLYIPIFGKIICQIQSAQFTLILGTLLHSGVKVVEALKITAHSSKNLAYRKLLEETAVRVGQGENIGTQLKEKNRMFSSTTVSMIDVGEKTGKLSESLIALSEFAEKEVDRVMRDLSSLIEPVVLILMGIVVGFVALSIVSPIYQLSQAVSM